MGMAPPVLSRWSARAACVICSFPGERVRGMARIASDQLAASGTHACGPLEVVFVSHAANDRHESRVSRDAGYVSDLPAAILAFRPRRAIPHRWAFDDRRGN